jgi:hypothetical protein
VELINTELGQARTTLQSAMCFLLTALVAFSFGTHPMVAATGLVPQLVALCRPSCKLIQMVSIAGDFIEAVTLKVALKANILSLYLWTGDEKYPVWSADVKLRRMIQTR